MMERSRRLTRASAATTPYHATMTIDTTDETHVGADVDRA